jgi:hypothetical protein
VVRRHFIRTLRNRSCAWFQVDDELNSSRRGYSWKFLWEDILKIMNNGNVLDAFKR